ncbi:MAG TPA: hypothetical protein IAA60_02415 [Candidatus Ornithomonoglobus intestinigallinarum]|uniref:Uncharacterized protein n=1 Tax=Candidatus Ornithomonoglobus intestinigallinarum TaxID=2840894 RepID=A0A9D1H1S1_9FIRM|nr:hypothetical protein [Candidatus Ornithomonoglobus intestinigallinarum]
MLGVLIYLYFLFIGFLYANELFKEKDIFTRAWMGGIFGSLIMMAGLVPFALIFGFSYAAHIALIVIAAVPYAAIKLRRREKLFSVTKCGEETMDMKIFICLILPVSLIIWVLMTNHILTPYEGGGAASGQCTYGDLQMHLGFVTSIAEQGKFPPDYAFLSGERLNYPFFIDMLSSSLYLFGTPLRWAVLIPSYIISLLLVGGFYITAYRITGKKSASVLAVIFFFINGGFGFAYFFEGAKADPAAFTKIFTDYYHTPTNYNEMNIRWSNTICDMIIPQRTTMAGWCMILPCIYLLLDALKTRSGKLFITLGIIAGCMPMIHTHSFLALGIISAVMFFAYLYEEKDKKAYIVNWVFYGAAALILAMPQLIFWTFSQTSGNSSFLNFRFNWVNQNDPYLWFYIKNWGMAFLLAIPAFINAEKNQKKLFIAGAAIFALAEFIQFQPNEYDNNKLFYITYMITLIIVSDFAVNLYERLKGIKWRPYFAALVILSFTLSGALTIGREYVSGGMYQTFDENAIETAEYIKENVPPDAVVLTDTDHLNPVVTLAGRTVYVGSSLYVYFHGFTDEYAEREAELEALKTASGEELKDFCTERGISYIYTKTSDFLPQSSLSEFECIYSSGANRLYKII